MNDKIIRFSIVLALLLGFPARAEENFKQQWQQAKEFVEAGFHQQAFDIYEELLRQKLTPSQRASVIINQSAVLIAMERWEEAVSQLRSLSLGEDPSPRIVLYLKINMAEALMRRVQQLLQDIGGTEEVFEKISEWLQESLTALDDAEEAQRQLWIIEGREDVELPEYFEAMRRRVKRLMVDLISYREQYLADHRDFKERLQYTLRQLAFLINRLEGLAFIEPEEELLSHHMEFLRQQEELHSEWRRLREHIMEQTTSKEEGPAQQKEAIFLEAEREYFSGIDMLKEEKLWKARAAFAISKLYLSLLYHIETGEDPILDMLKERIVVIKKIEEAHHHQHLLESLSRGKKTIVGLIQQLLGALKEKFSEQRQEGDEGFVMLLKQCDLLLQNLSTNDEEPLRSAIFDAHFYQQLLKREEDVLGQLYAIVSQQGEHDVVALLTLVRVVDTKFDLRRALRGDDATIDDVRSILKEALALETVNLEEDQKIQQLRFLIEKALLAWAPEQVLVVKIQQLLDDYGRIVALSVLKESDIVALQPQHEKIQEIVQIAKDQRTRAEFYDILESDLNNALVDNQLAIKFLARRWPASVRIFLEDAMQWLQRSLEMLTAGSLDSPVKVLEKLIAGQYDAASLSDKVRHFPQEEEPVQEIKNVLLVAQTRVLDMAAIFVDVAKQWVELQTPDNNWEQISRQDPWPEVLQLFALGIDSARRSEALLREDELNSEEILKSQNEAISAWQQALNKLHREQPPKEQRDEGKQPPPEKEEKAQQEQQASLKENHDAVLRLLQEMQHDDEKLQDVKVTTPKRGLRPW